VALAAHRPLQLRLHGGTFRLLPKPVSVKSGQPQRDPVDGIHLAENKTCVGGWDRDPIGNTGFTHISFDPLCSYSIQGTT
jgi:hypothetical protein